ncbi:5-(carboxyamino)imidazole ribonucleotide synthase [bacterium]|nr:5-(carboxyamino)imidazole ribonucleotide synthase [bacterium]
MIGILGGGQLGRMLALAAHRLGIGVRTLETVADAPASSVSELYVGSFDDVDALDRFAKGLSAVTYEFENVPVGAAQHLAEHVPVYPPPSALEVAQDRWAEKRLFRSLGIDTPAFAIIDDDASFEKALREVGLPAVLKTRRGGYDGKGQYVVKTLLEARQAYQELGRAGLILEEFVHFDRELSLVAVRSQEGESRFYPLVENHHREGILRQTIAPAPGVTPAVEAVADIWAKRLLDHWNYVGVFAVELFAIGDKLLANEIAPRVHNSGHWTMEGAEVCQFENHLRAVAGLPLGSTAVRAPTTMINLIGQIPDRASILSLPGAHLHLYGKEPRPGRKVGHINIRVVPDADHAEVVQQALRRAQSDPT